MNDEKTDAPAETWDAKDYQTVEDGAGNRVLSETRLVIRKSYDEFDLSMDIMQVDPLRPQRPVALCSKVEMRTHQPGEMLQRPIRITKAAAQDIVDQLCEIGIRPSSAPDIPIGEKQAMAEHINDLRSERDFDREIIHEVEERTKEK